MVQGLLGSVAVARVHLQEPSNQVLSVLGDVLPIGCIERKVPQAHLRKDLGVGFSKERRVAAEQNVHDDSDAPQITELIVLSSKHLRCNIIWSTCLCRQHLISLELAREAKVNDLKQVFFNRFLCHEEEIFRFQVAVAHVVLMHVIDGADDLLHKHGGLHLSEMACLNDPVEQLASNSELHDQVDVAAILKTLVQFDDVRVVHHLHDGDFLLKPLDVLHLRLGYGLDGANRSGALVPSLGNGAIRALAELL
mmetsp:Transcript_12886/g.32497  ORF Transcript_12886/g.32497 Transcript_12886/m.32497 type:complete len:251 (+) Transcript_12886:771-1523(+)